MFKKSFPILYSKLLFIDGSRHRAHTVCMYMPLYIMNLEESHDYLGLFKCSCTIQESCIFGCFEAVAKAFFPASEK